LSEEEKDEVVSDEIDIDKKSRPILKSVKSFS
jgi:hypothetical protein